MQFVSKFTCTQMTHGEKCQSLYCNIDKFFTPWFTFLLINWSWVRVPPHPFTFSLLKRKSKQKEKNKLACSKSTGFFVLWALFICVGDENPNAKHF